MGNTPSTASKAKSTKSDSSSYSSSRAVVPVTESKSTIDHTVEPVALMMTLINAGISQDVGLFIIMRYMAIPSLRTVSPYNPLNPNQFFVGRPQCLSYAYDLSNLGEADQFCIWGQFKEVERILDENPKDKLLLTTSIDGEDHRGPGFIPSGTLLQRALYVGDVLNEDEKSGETMADMLGRCVIDRCGEEEFKKQVGRAQEIIEEENKKKVAMEADDIKALNKAWQILKDANKDTLESNAELKTALAEFKNQLKKLGNENIIEKAEELFDRDYAEFGYYNSPKNNFAKNRIIGLAQRERLSVCDLQMCFPGLNKSLNGAKITAARIDVRRELGVLSTGGSSFILGVYCHLDYYGACGTVAARWLRPRRCDARAGGLVLGDLCRAKTSRYKKLCSNWTIHQTTSLRF